MESQDIISTSTTPKLITKNFSWTLNNFRLIEKSTDFEPLRKYLPIFKGCCDMRFTLGRLSGYFEVNIVLMLENRCLLADKSHIKTKHNSWDVKVCMYLIGADGERKNQEKFVYSGETIRYKIGKDPELLLLSSELPCDGYLELRAEVTMITVE